MLSPETERYLGTTLAGQYRVEAVIGSGGMGVVYRAHQLSVGRDVAVKLLRRELANDLHAAMRFENEARVISKLRHPNTLRLYDCQRTDEGDLLIVTELLSGAPLSTLLRQQGHLTIDRAIRITDHVCRSLAEAHALGIVHRDLKPANVFIERVGLDDLVKVLDFGIAKILEGNTAITRAGAINGTPAYMSPEQVRGVTIDARSDIYSLGVMLFEMLAGKPPFTGGAPIDILRRQVNERPPPPSRLRGGAVPEPLERLLASMLEKAPDLRPSSVDAVLGDLARISSELKTEPLPLLDTLNDPLSVTERAPAPAIAISPAFSAAAEPTEVAARTPQRRSRGPWIAFAAGVLTAAVLVAAVMAGEQQPPPPEPAPRVIAPEPSPPPPPEPLEVATATVAEKPELEPEPEPDPEPDPEPEPELEPERKRERPRPRPKRKVRPKLGVEPVPVEID